ncbi:MAG TPA: SpoIIE family protein phosphatase [Rectinemataceae bacterium]|nr:SpoIIE family protein phosphatase [Rectinemataceae bacterium]
MDNEVPAAQRDRPKVLIIEDSPLIAQGVVRILTLNGLEALVAPSAAEGYALAAALLPDLILLDVLLPDGDGFELCERLLATPSLTERPILFVTSLDDVESRVRGLSIGAVDFIPKPFIAEELVARVRIHLKLARQGRMIAAAQAERLKALRLAQKSILTDVEAMPASRCSVLFEAAEEAGGDQYEVIELSPGIHGYLVADIAGHGIESAFQASILKVLFRENASVLDTPSETLYMMNRALRRNLLEGQHVTAFYLVLNRLSSMGYFASAGHFPALSVTRGGELRRLSAEGDVLGVFETPHFQAGSFRIDKESRFWLYTDGVLEDFVEGRTWSSGLERLEGEVIRSAGLPRAEALAALQGSLLTSLSFTDDRLVMAVDA